ncbi:MAG: hypothetical protein JST94_05890 [Bacteroidetes bacterium]|nr:hypothetical protein [Bacteroidota bacterium]MBS1670968.1 hypothetical protein [Bacteroidota bacterium]
MGFNKKTISILLLLFFASIKINAQTKSNLQLKVDSILQHVLNFTGGKKTIIKNYGDYKTDTMISYATREAAITIPDSPLIIINKKLVEYKVLNNYTLQDVKNINVLARDASIATYGPQGLHGSVLITLNKKK